MGTGTSTQTTRVRLRLTSTVGVVCAGLRCPGHEENNELDSLGMVQVGSDNRGKRSGMGSPPKRLLRHFSSLLQEKT